MSKGTIKAAPPVFPFADHRPVALNGWWRETEMRVMKGWWPSSMPGFDIVGRRLALIDKKR